MAPPPSQQVAIRRQQLLRLFAVLVIAAGATIVTVVGLAYYSARLIDQASLQQKTALLKELHLYEDLFDAYHEVVHGEARDFAAFIARCHPRDLLFRSPVDLAREAVG